MGFGESLTASDVIRSKLSEWLNNVPEFDTVRDTYKQLGYIRRQIKLLARDINLAEEKVISNADKPRSNDTRKEKLEATRIMKNKLANYEAEESELEMIVKFMEFHRGMYASASYQSRELYDK